MMNARVPMLFLGDFAAGLGAAMMKTLNQNELPGIQTSHNGDRFQRDSADLLQSTALQSLDFHKSIFDAHCAEEYARDYSQVMEKLNKKWQEKEFARPSVPTTFLDPLPTGNTKSTMKRKSRRRFTGREAAEQEEAIKRRTKRKLSIERTRREKYDQLHEGIFLGSD